MADAVLCGRTRPQPAMNAELGIVSIAVCGELCKRHAGGARVKEPESKPKTHQQRTRNSRLFHSGTFQCLIAAATAANWWLVFVVIVVVGRENLCQPSGGGGAGCRLVEMLVVMFIVTLHMCTSLHRWRPASLTHKKIGQKSVDKLCGIIVKSLHQIL